MLIEFSVSNYKSIAERQVFSMLPAKGSSYLLETENPYYPHVLRIGGIFGANGSGKSTFLQALEFFQQLIAESGKFNSSDKIPVSTFKLDPSTRTGRSEFEIIFVQFGEAWRYGIEIDAKTVFREWLFHRSKATGRERRVLMREGASVSVSKGVSVGSEFLKSTTNDNQLMLSKLDQFSDAETKPAYIWLTMYLRTVLSSSNWFQSVTADKLYQGKHSHQINELLHSIGMKFDKIEIEHRTVEDDSSEEYSLLSSGKYLFGHAQDGVSHLLNLAFSRKDREGKNQNIFMEEESLGTRSLFGILGVLVDVLRTGMVIVIDELNQSFHPEFLRLVVELVRSPEANFGGAQLIFSAHDTSVMSILERDELWITEKQEDGATLLFSLADMGAAKQGGPRRRGVFGKHYLENKYGGLPEIDFIRAVKAMKSLAH